jgi:hypothetical protein
MSKFRGNLQLSFPLQYYRNTGNKEQVNKHLFIDMLMFMERREEMSGLL